MLVLHDASGTIACTYAPRIVTRPLRHRCTRTVGPFGTDPVVLRACIVAGTPVYADLSDPLPYIAAAKALSREASASGTRALVLSRAVSLLLLL